VGVLGVWKRWWVGLRVYDSREFEERRGFNINQWGGSG